MTGVYLHEYSINTPSHVVAFAEESYTARMEPELDPER